MVCVCLLVYCNVEMEYDKRAHSPQLCQTVKLHMRHTTSICNIWRILHLRRKLLLSPRVSRLSNIH